MLSQTGGRQMNEREELKVANIMAKVLDMGLSKYHTLFLTQMAIRRYKKSMKGKEESIDKTLDKIMRRMQSLCKETKGLENKIVIETSWNKSRAKLEEELSDANLPDELLNGEILENVLEYLVKD